MSWASSPPEAGAAECLLSSALCFYNPPRILARNVASSKNRLKVASIQPCLGASLHHHFPDNQEHEHERQPQPNSIDRRPSPTPRLAHGSELRAGAQTGVHHGAEGGQRRQLLRSGTGCGQPDRDDGRQQMNSRSIYRSPGMTSSPDLTTGEGKGKSDWGWGKKEKEREKEKGREKEMRKRAEREQVRERDREGYEQQTLRQPTGAYSSATLVASPSSFGERVQRDETAGDWIMANARKEATVKPQKSSVRAKTSALWAR